MAKKAAGGNKAANKKPAADSEEKQAKVSTALYFKMVEYVY